MSGTLSQGQMAALSNFLTIAQMELAENDQQQTVAYLNQYYSTLASYGSGYAALAQNVVDNTTPAGEVANLLVANAIGAQAWQTIRLQVAVSLAEADYQDMVSNGTNGGGALATAAQIDDFHAEVFGIYGIPLTAWGGDAFAVLGLDWSGGALSPYELSSGQSNSSYFTNQTESAVNQAIGNLFSASTPVWSALLDGGISTFIASAITFENLEIQFGARFGINPLVTTEQFGDGENQIQDTDPSDSVNSIIFDDVPDTSFTTGSGALVAIYANNVSVTNSGNGSTDGINSTDDVVNSTGNTIDSGSSSSLTVNGTANNIAIGANGFLNLFGVSNTVSFSTGDLSGVYGGGNDVFAQSGDHIYLSGTDTSSDTVTVSNDNSGSNSFDGEAGGIFLDNNTQANIFGSNNTLGLGGSGDSIGAYGNSNTIDADAGNWIVVGSPMSSLDLLNISGDVGGGSTANGQPTGIAIDPDAAANVEGGDDAVYLQDSSSYIGLLGGSGYTVVTYTGGSVATSPDTSFNMFGSYTQIYTGVGDTLGVYGSSNTISAQVGNTVAVGNTDGGIDSITVTDDQSGIFVDPDAAVNVGGGDDAVSLSDGSSYVGLIGYSGYNVWATSGGSIATTAGVGFTVNGNGAHINDLGGGDSITVNGGSNAIYAQSNDYIDVGGTGSNIDSVFVSGDQGSTTDAYGDQALIDVNSGAEANIDNGGNDLVYAGTGSYVGLLGGAGYAIGGSDITVATLSNTDFNVFGSSNDLNLASGDSAGIYDGGGNFVNAAPNAQVDLAGTNGDTDTVVTNNNTSGAFIDADTQANIDGSNDRVYLLGGDTSLTVSGSNEFIEDEDSSSGIFITANDTYVDLPSSDTVTLYGSDDYVSGSNNNLTEIGNDDVTAGNYNYVESDGSDDYTTSSTDIDSGSETYESDFDYNDFSSNYYGGYTFQDDGGYGMRKIQQRRHHRASRSSRNMTMARDMRRKERPPQQHLPRQRRQLQINQVACPARNRRSYFGPSQQLPGASPQVQAAAPHHSVPASANRSSR